MKLRPDTRLVPDEDNCPESDFILTGPSCWIVVGNLQLYIRKLEYEDGEKGVSAAVYALGDAMGPCYGATIVLESEIESEEE